jgi:hypothetical protein
MSTILPSRSYAA